MFKFLAIGRAVALLIINASFIMAPNDVVSEENAAREMIELRQVDLSAKEVEGYMHEIKDGDSFILRSENNRIQEIRLLGIDSPEYQSKSCKVAGKVWNCADAARSALLEITKSEINKSAKIKCLSIEYDRYQRLVAICYVLGRDIGKYLVVEGYSQICERYSMRYHREEASAKKRKKGIWRASYLRSYQCRKR